VDPQSQATCSLSALWSTRSCAATGSLPLWLGGTGLAPAMRRVAAWVTVAQARPLAGKLRLPVAGSGQARHITRLDPELRDNESRKGA
jgi:hypothetical protein